MPEPPPAGSALTAARTGRRIGWTLAAAAALIAYALAFQGSRGLWEPDEGRYTNIATQMLRSGDFVVPAFNDEVPHFAKPPLTYWAIAAGIAALGWNEWGVRLANALAFVVTVIVVHRLGRRVTPGRPWLPALVYATFLLPYVAANVVTTDTLLTLWESCAGLAFVTWWERRDGPRWRPPLFAMWLALALAFLTKGPAGLLPLPAFAAFAWLAGGWRTLRRLLCVGGLAVFAVVGLGWYAFVAATSPGVLDYFVRDEFARRIASGAFRRNAGWFRAIETYAPTLAFGALPWAVWWVPAMRAAGRGLLRRAWWRRRLAERPVLVLLALWVAVPLAVFAASSSRLPLYLLPLFVPLALLTAASLPAPARPRRAALLVGAWVASLVGIRLLGATLHNEADGRETAQAIAAELAAPPDEVVFVDARPVWGLSLYLRCEVERLYTRAEPGITAEGVSLERLPTELARREPGTLLLIRPRDEPRAAGSAARLGLPWVEVGQVGDLLLVSPFGDLRPAAGRERAP